MNLIQHLQEKLGDKLPLDQSSLIIIILIDYLGKDFLDYLNKSNIDLGEEINNEIKRYFSKNQTK